MYLKRIFELTLICFASIPVLSTLTSASPSRPARSTCSGEGTVACFHSRTDLQGHTQRQSFQHHRSANANAASSCRRLQSSFHGTQSITLQTQNPCIQLCSDVSCRNCTKFTRNQHDLRDLRNRVRAVKGCCTDCYP